MKKPIVAIPMGDPAGIGPEIIIKALSESEVYNVCNPVLIGDSSVIKNALKICSLNLKLNEIEEMSKAKFQQGIIDIVNLNNVNLKDLKIGEIHALGGKSSFEYIEKSVQLAMDKHVDAIATTPINKESLKAAKIDFIGHTEILASLSNTVDPLTMFEVDNMRVFFLSRHVSLKRACEMVTKERMIDYIKRSTAALEKMGIKGTMAIAGLNPHSGEHGLFGNEEVNHVTPAVEHCQSLGYDVVGPIGADSVFYQALKGKYQAVLSLYHDQGHIATKTYDFERTIAITHGMPFLRTSVDHGTAFDIAGKGVASAVSMIEAIKLAAKYAPHFIAQ